MSVLLEFSIFPTDKGSSVSKYVSEIIAMVRNQPYPYILTAMGTIIETDQSDQALDIISKACKLMEEKSDRVYCSFKMDIQKGKNMRLKTKIESIEDKIGTVEK